jgi:hypothetical protein
MRLRHSASNPVATHRSSATTAPRLSASATHLIRSSATAHILYADFLGTCLSCTSAQAGPQQSGGEARGTRLLNEPAYEGQAPANGYDDGAMVSLPTNPLLRLAIDRWQVRSWASDTRSGAHAQATLLDLVLVDPSLLHLTAGDARSDAETVGGGSAASSQSDALTASAAGGTIEVVLLHADSSSRGTGSTYIVRMNSGSALLESRDAATNCSVAVNRVACLRLLHGDRDGAEVGSAQDGRSQPVVGLVTGWSGAGDSSEPLR